uniref:Uncharacterized protein n=1 Tax=Candidatus Nitrotoga fabula TaxID=2182327 RepID=A0A2X0QUE1_9PROT|nr:protein of unknown function [Candidatus Nitrotoga fabula]
MEQKIKLTTTWKKLTHLIFIPS